MESSLSVHTGKEQKKDTKQAMRFKETPGRPTPSSVAGSVETAKKMEEVEVIDLTVKKMEEVEVVDLTSSTLTSTSSSCSSSSSDSESQRRTFTTSSAQIADDGRRRSERDKKSTLIYIGGQAVLAKNNYVVKGGTYEYQPVVSTLRPVTKSRASLQHSKKKPKVKETTVSPLEQERYRHNAKIQQRIVDKQQARHSFLQKHVHVLAPFLTPNVEQSLIHAAETNATVPKEMGLEVQVTEPRGLCRPPGMDGDGPILRDYQLRGLEFMAKMHRQNLGMILGDEMGLGKTLQTISLFCHLKEQEDVTGPSLVVCPLTVLASWCSELQRWAPHLKVLRLHSSEKVERHSQRQQLSHHASKYDVVLTTYEMAKIPKNLHAFSRWYFNYVVLDEGHKIKGRSTLIADAVRKIHCENKLLLTGTPLQNNLTELWSLLEFLYPKVFTTSKPFDDAFNLTENHVDRTKLSQAQAVLDLFMIRRLKNQVEKLMPLKLETKVYCPMSKTQVFWYKALLLKDVSMLSRLEERCGGDDDTGAVGHQANQFLRNLFMQLRKCCQHPFLFPGAETDPDKTPLEEVIGASGKLAVLDMLLRSLCQKGHRAVLFSQFTKVLDVLEDYCLARGWNYCRFDGGTARAKRNFIVRQFNADPSPYFLFLMSTRSGGMGLNLQSADTCILFDSDWNPQNDLQAMARVHRIGQTKKVHVYRLISAGTVEERIVERAEKKLLLDQTVNKETETATDEAGGMSTKELLSHIKFGCDAIFGDKSKHALPSLEDIDLLTDRSRKETDTVGLIIGGAAKNAESFDAEKQFSATQVFGGVDFQALREAQTREELGKLPKTMSGIAHVWKEISGIIGVKRKVKNRVVYHEGNNSGYGNRLVPVLKSNDYDLEGGEVSVFNRELSSSKKQNFAVQKKKRVSELVNQSHCQVCLDGGSLVCCPRCPVSLHLECAGYRRAKDFQSCSHHYCKTCDKPSQQVGGLLFPCQVCTDCFCEDCLPISNEGFRILGACERFEQLGFNSTKRAAYIHCCKDCEDWAIKELNWTEPSVQQVCPEPIDGLSDHFV